jgi:glycosyltransferase involved in cell wall biosynthesis
MKIGVEVTALTRKQRTGVDYYTQQLLSAMARARPDYRFELGYFQFMSKPHMELGVTSPNVAELRNPWLPSMVYKFLFRLGLAPPFDLIMGMRDDFFLFPNFVHWPLAYCRRTGIVVYDLSFIHSSGTMTRRLRSFLFKKVPKSIAKSDIIITISETIRRELVQQYHIRPEKIHIAFPGVNRTVFYPRTEAESVATLDTCNLRWRQFILYVGTIEPRKNIERLFEAYAALPKDTLEKIPLALVGGKGWMDQGIYRKFEELKARGLDIRMLGYIPHEQLPDLYSASAAFAFPSLYEGFGMPLLEAMACGAAVITSDRSSIPEVVGEAGILIDPEDVSALSGAMERLLRDEGLADRARQAGINRAQGFSWETSAEVVLKAIESITKVR